LLTEEDIESKNSNTIWRNFQPKFGLTLELYNYHEFFRQIFIEVLKTSIEEKCYIIELKHIFGCVIDQDRKNISFEKELELIMECIEEGKKIEPLLEVRLVV